MYLSFLGINLILWVVDVIISRVYLVLFMSSAERPNGIAQCILGKTLLELLRASKDVLCGSVPSSSPLSAERQLSLLLQRFTHLWACTTFCWHPEDAFTGLKSGSSRNLCNCINLMCCLHVVTHSLSNEGVALWRLCSILSSTGM